MVILGIQMQTPYYPSYNDLPTVGAYQTKF